MNEFLIMINVVLAIALIITNIILIRYRRQIREVCRQLSFHQNIRTNQEIRIDVRSKEIMKLQNEINQIFVQFRELELQYKDSEENLKDVITNISHDIRTPLTSINGYFQLLCNTSEEEERKKYAEIIAGRMDSMSMLLEQLFTYVRIQNGGFQITPVVCDVKQILCENLFSFYEDFKQKGIVPQVKLPEDVFFASLDLELFTRVLQNVLKNALVHGDEKIIVTLSSVGKSIVLNIKNHTIEEHTLDPDMVFTRFYQGDKSRNKNSSGLGLCIAKELLQEMGGEIKAYYQDDYFGIEIILQKTE